MEPIDLARLLRDVIDEFDDGEEASINVRRANAEPKWSPSDDVVRRINRALHDLDVEILKAFSKQKRSETDGS